jgi:hypothetical protein
MKLNNFAYLKFKKIILRKFSSKPKLKTFLRERYFTLNYLARDGDTTQLRVQDVPLYGEWFWHRIVTTTSFLTSNIYLNSSLYIVNNRKKIPSDVWSKTTDESKV